MVALLSFVLSAVLDNLTTSIVMMSLVRKLVTDESDRMYYGGIVIIAANSGGAWSPIGDVTTTMLWIGEQITAASVVRNVILPSLVSVVVPVLWVGLRMRGEITRRGLRENGPIVASAPSPTSGLTSFTLPDDAAAIGRSLSQLNLRTHTGATVVTVARGGVTTRVSPGEMLHAGDMLELSGTTETAALALNLLINGLAPMRTTPLERRVVFVGGVGALLFVPMFKTITHLPPFMGILLGLGVLWTLTEVIHKKKTDEGKGRAVGGRAPCSESTPRASCSFSASCWQSRALQSEGILAAFARRLNETISNVNLVTLAIGLTSAVVDNVPLVAAAQGMYPLSNVSDRSSFLAVPLLLRRNRRQHPHHRLGRWHRGDGNPADHFRLVRAASVATSPARLRCRSSDLPRDDCRWTLITTIARIIATQRCCFGRSRRPSRRNTGDS